MCSCKMNPAAISGKEKSIITPKKLFTNGRVLDGSISLGPGLILFVSLLKICYFFI